jgi:hypothetical protein
MGFTIFVSHATEDAPLVHALQTLIEDTLDEVTVRSSSSRPARGGIEPGSSWLEWIYESVANSDATLLILTSASYDRPWLLWEAGAVSGVSLAVDAQKPIVPLIFEIALDEIPGPLRNRQAASGGRAEGVTDLLQMLYERVQRPSLSKFQRLLGPRVSEYLQEVALFLQDRPLVASGDVVRTSKANISIYEKVFQGEDLDLNTINFSQREDPKDTSGVAIGNSAGDWVIEIDVESPLRGMRHAIDVRFRRGTSASKGKIWIGVDSGEVEKHEEIIDLATLRYDKYVVEYLIYRHVSRIAKVGIRPLDDDAKQADTLYLDCVSVYSLPRGGRLRDMTINLRE